VFNELSHLQASSPPIVTLGHVLLLPSWGGIRNLAASPELRLPSAAVESRAPAACSDARGGCARPLVRVEFRYGAQALEFLSPRKPAN
jgi:hypothetical protein